MRQVCLCRFEGEEIRFLGSSQTSQALLLVESPPVRHGVVPLPPGRRSRKRAMRYEAAEMLELSPEEVVHGWRPLNGGQALLLAVPRREAEAWWRRLAKAGKRMAGAVSLLDALVLEGRGGKGNYLLLFFAGQELHLLHFHQGTYALHRQMALGSVEEMVTEVRRSAFFARQQYKAPPEAALLLNPPTWLDEEARDRLGQGLGLNIEVRSLGDEDPKLALLQRRLSQRDQFILLLPPGLAQDLFLERWNRWLAPPLGLALTVCLVWGGHAWKCLQWERATLEACRERGCSIGLVVERHRESLERLRSLQRELQMVQNHLSQRTWAYLYLAPLPRLLPEGVHLLELSLEEKSALWCTLKLQMETKDSDRGYRRLRGLVKRLEGVPLVKEVNLEVSEFLNNGRATLRLRLERIRDVSADLAVG